MGFDSAFIQFCWRRLYPGEILGPTLAGKRTNPGETLGLVGQGGVGDCLEDDPSGWCSG